MCFLGVFCVLIKQKKIFYQSRCGETSVQYLLECKCNGVISLINCLTSLFSLLKEEVIVHCCTGMPSF